MSDRGGSRGMLHWLLLSVGVFVLDWLTKQWASQALVYGEPVPVMPFFNLTLLHNTGAAFSFLAGESGWQRWFFVILALVISAILIVWLARLPRNDRWMAVALALVLGGALGNLYDRVLLGYVVDFIHLYVGDHHFPAFNIADTAISIGAAMIALDVFRKPAPQTDGENS
ncbi:signal peptidase II [Hahella sp. SMD15-11]|uniref:Lipoprotein signal peptidase n=1 Tax=Thermohahella caldifontis TaxID=3142973 RepID=A0AB39V1C3_9GAMM